MNTYVKRSKSVSGDDISGGEINWIEALYTDRLVVDHTGTGGGTGSIDGSTFRIGGSEPVERVHADVVSGQTIDFIENNGSLGDFLMKWGNNEFWIRNKILSEIVVKIRDISNQTAFVGEDSNFVLYLGAADVDSSINTSYNLNTNSLNVRTLTNFSGTVTQNSGTAHFQNLTSFFSDSSSIESVPARIIANTTNGSKVPLLVSLYLNASQDDRRDPFDNLYDLRSRINNWVDANATAVEKITHAGGASDPVVMNRFSTGINANPSFKFNSGPDAFQFKTSTEIRFEIRNMSTDALVNSFALTTDIYVTKFGPTLSIAWVNANYQVDGISNTQDLYFEFNIDDAGANNLINTILPGGSNYLSHYASVDMYKDGTSADNRQKVSAALSCLKDSGNLYSCRNEENRCAGLPSDIGGSWIMDWTSVRFVWDVESEFTTFV